MVSLWTKMTIMVSIMVLIPLCDGTYKLCCDPKCETPISHGRTRSRKTVREEGHLTFPANAKLTIWAKHYNSQPNVWEAEMYGRWGLVNENDIDESIVHCSVPQHWVPVNSQTVVDKLTDLSHGHVMSSEKLVLPTLTSLSETETLSWRTMIPNFEKENVQGTDNDQSETTLPEVMIPIDGGVYNEVKNDITQVSIPRHPSIVDISDDDDKNDEERQLVTQTSSPTPNVLIEQEEKSSEQEENNELVLKSDDYEKNFDGSFYEEKTDSGSNFEEHQSELSNGVNTDSISLTVEPRSSTSNLLDEEKPQMMVTTNPSPSESYNIDVTNVAESFSPSKVSEFQESPISTQNEEHQATEKSESESIDNVSASYFFNSGRNDQFVASDSPISLPKKDNSLHNHHDSFHKEIGDCFSEQDSSFNEDNSCNKAEFFPENQHTPQNNGRQIFDSEPSFPHETKASLNESSRIEEPLFSKNYNSLYVSVSSNENKLKVSTQNEHHSFNEEQSTQSVRLYSFQDIHTSEVEHIQVTSQEEQISSNIELLEMNSFSEDYLLISPSSTKHFQEMEYLFSTEQDLFLHSINMQSHNKLSSIALDDSSHEENVRSVIASENNVHASFIIDSQDSSFILRSIKMFLPLSVEAWLFSEGYSNGSLLGICISLFVVTFPILCGCYNTQRKALKIKKELKSMQDCKKNMESYINKLTDEKNDLKSHASNLEVQVNDCQLKLENEKQGNWDLENIRRNLEKERNTLEESYRSLQNEYSHNVMSLKLELKNSNEQSVILIEENNGLQFQIASIEAQVKEAIQKKEESDAAKVQLEQDIFDLRQQLHHITLEHNELMKDKENINHEHSEVCDMLNSTRERLEKANEIIAEGNTEITVLRECIKNLSELDGEETSVQMEKIESLLDSTKVQTELRTASDERDKLQLEVQSQTLLLDQLQTQNAALQQELTDVYSAKDNVLQQYQETQIKLKAITEYFEEKESHLHRKIGEEEIVRQRVESREAYAKERVDLIEQEREKEREELRELRQQMGDIEKGLMQQVITNEKRAEDALSQLRKTEQELRLANKEITLLKKQIADEDESSNSSSIIHGMSPHLGPVPHPRPLLKPRPRGPPRIPPSYGPYGPRGLPLPPFQSSSPVSIDDKDARKASQEKNVLSRPPPPGMESREPYYQRRNYPPPMPRPGIHSRSPVSFGKPGDPSFDRLSFHSDRPPIPGDMGFYPPRPYPPRKFISSDRRPPSEPLYEDLLNRSCPPSNPPIVGAGVLFSSSVEDPVKYSRPTPILLPSQSLPLNVSKENEQVSFD